MSDDLLDDLLEKLAERIASRLVDFRPLAKASAESRLLTSQELAARLSVHEHTVRRWVKLGCPHEALPGRGTRFRFDLAAVTAWLRARRSA